MEADQRATSEYSESLIYDEVHVFKYKTKLVFCKQEGNAFNAWKRFFVPNTFFVFESETVQYLRLCMSLNHLAFEDIKHWGLVE